MKIIQKRKLQKLISKNTGNVKLVRAINELIEDIENANWKSNIDIINSRNDANCVHNDGFYFFDINSHRTMALIGFEEGEAVVVWVGSHDKYSRTFKNNKRTIERWLRNHGLIK